MITEEELKYREWRDNPDFPNLDERQAFVAKNFIERLTGPDFPKPLYTHQYEAILRTIYNGEKMGKWECLLDIVTGGGKTTIMAALVAYFWQVRNCEKFLLIVPNTIVRERVKEDFEIKNPAYAYAEFPFFFNAHSKAPSRLVCKVLRDSGDANGIKDANVIVANIHQLYEGRQSQALETLLAPNITPELVIFNDEAHNAAADQYREVLKLLRPRTIARVDLTATPYRLDKEDLDTFPPIYEYHVEQAICEGVVKQVVVTKPDIESVKLQYEEWDDENKVIRTLDAEEMPWEQIEAELKRGGAVKFVTAKNARRQQLQIAQSCFDYQKKCVPLDLQGQRQWEPLMLAVALSQKDAEQIYETLQKAPFNYSAPELLLVHSKQIEVENKKAFLLGRKSPEGLSKEDTILWEETRKVRIIIAVSMLREGWDVRNIAVICLFRKFSYQKKGDRIYTVYGPQIIGRGLRRIRPQSELDPLFAVDHPAFNHQWLWEILSAQEFARPLNPGDKISDDDIKKVERVENKDEIDKNAVEQEGKPEIDIEEIISSLPPIPENTQPVPDWQEHFKNLAFNKKIVSALQKITNVKTHRLGSSNTSHEIPDKIVNVEELNENTATQRQKLSREEIAEMLKSEISNEPHQVLMSVFRSETAEQLQQISQAIGWILKEKYGVNDLADLDKQEADKLNEIMFSIPQIFDELRKPEVVLAILGE